MRNQVLGAFCVALVCQFNCFGQSKNDQIKQLQKLAHDNEVRATNAEELAEKYNRLAQDAQREVERQRYLSLAVSIARKSIEVDDNALAGLLALQAYKYNVRFKGYEFDKDIYQGLLSAQKRFDNGRKNLAGFKLPVRALITKPEMGSILGLEAEGRVIRWSNEDGEWDAKELSPTKEGFNVLGASIRPDGRLWIIGKRKQVDSRIGIYDITYSSRRLDGVHDQISRVSFLPESNGFYALSSSGHKLYYCDPQQGNEVVKLGEEITLMDVSRDGSKLAAVTTEGNLYVWDVKKEYASSVYKIADAENRVTALAFTPTGKDIVFGNVKGQINFMATTAGVVRKTLSGHFSQIEKIVFDHLGSAMAVADKSNIIRVWNLGDLNRWPLVIDEGAPIENMSFLADGSQLAIATTVNSLPVHLWPMSSEKMANEICKFMSRNMSTEEWETYIGYAPYETTCTNLPSNDR